MADSQIFLALSIMLFASLLGYFISKKLKQPISVGVIVIGIILGPSLLGIVHYDDTIAVIANIGSIVLLFISGLHSNIAEVYTKRNLMIALFGTIVPVLGGFIVGIIWDFPLFTSIFIGTTLTATCLGITSSVLKELGIMKTETAKAMIGAAVIDDVISLTILSIVLGFGGSGDASIWKIGLNLLYILGFIFAMVIFGPKVFTLIIDSFNRFVIRTEPKFTFAFGLALVFLFSYLSAYIGLAPIVGAFLIGVCLSKSRSINFMLAGSEYFELIFTSMFFIVIGAVVELNSFFAVFWLMLVLTAVALFTKLIGCGLAAYFMGFNKKDATIIGVGMAPRGEVAFIIALNGMLLGVITKEVYTAIVFMSFFTTIIALVALKSLYRGKAPQGDIGEEFDFIDMKIKR